MYDKIHEVTVDLNTEMLTMKLDIIARHCKAMADELEELSQLGDTREFDSLLNDDEDPESSCNDFDEDEEEKMTADYFETRRKNK